MNGYYITTPGWLLITLGAFLAGVEVAVWRQRVKRSRQRANQRAAKRQSN